VAAAGTVVEAGDVAEAVNLGEASTVVLREIVQEIEGKEIEVYGISRAVEVDGWLAMELQDVRVEM